MSSLEEAVRALVRDELRRLGVAPDTIEISSDSLPPGIVTKKYFARVCALGGVEGAVQDGRRGAWRCSREAWHKARDRRAREPAPRVESRLKDDELATSALAGLSTARSRRHA